MVRALLIEWDPSTGERAGNINPKETALRCNGWQNMDVIPAIELRLVEDDRDLSKYNDVDGVTILLGADTINAAIDDHFPSKYVVEDDLLYTEHFKQNLGKGINIRELPDDRAERLKVLKNTHGIKGIMERKPMKV